MSELGDRAVKHAAKVKAELGYFDVVGHGTPEGIYNEAGSLIGAKELAEQIRATPSWKGQDVRLLSCSTGQLSCGLAQGVSSELGVNVKAPTTDFAVSGRGRIYLDPGGVWKVFAPKS